MTPRNVDEIALGPNGNLQGGITYLVLLREIFSKVSGKTQKCARFQLVPLAALIACARSKRLSKD